LFTNRSLANLKAGNKSEAVADAREAVKLDPKNGKGWVRLGDGLVAEGGAEKEAEESCEFTTRFFLGLLSEDPADNIADERNSSWSPFRSICSGGSSGRSHEER